MNLNILLSMLTAKDTQQSYGTLLELEHLSEESSDLYPYTEQFAELVSNKAWAVRCRGFRLFCKQAQWDEGGVIDRIWIGRLQFWRMKSQQRCGRPWRRCWMWCRTRENCGLLFANG